MLDREDVFVRRRFGPGSIHERLDECESPVMIGTSPAIRAVSEQIRRIAGSDAPVLIQGETGSGKELAARAIHARSARAARRFVPVNCGAIPDTLVEAELFGHEKGAFTDADRARPGVIADAHGGTLFLDEVNALSLKAQVTLLRFLQDLRYRPIGHSKELTSDVRIIAATNEPVSALAGRGTFRPDLLFRLNILALVMPPLRERRVDIELLADYFISVFSAKYGLPPKRLHPDTVAWLHTHPWPGNVRELENWIHRELLLAEGDEIRHGRVCAPAAAPDAPELPDLRSAKARALAEFEREYLSRVLAATHGNVTRAARLAGKERRAFGKLLKKYHIDKSCYTL